MWLEKALQSLQHVMEQEGTEQQRLCRHVDPEGEDASQLEVWSSPSMNWGRRGLELTIHATCRWCGMNHVVTLDIAERALLEA